MSHGDAHHPEDRASRTHPPRVGRVGHDTLVITDRGRAVAVTVSLDRWNELQTRLEDLEDAVAILEHRAAPNPAPRGEVYA